jgi:hypothetical protein
MAYQVGATCYDSASDAVSAIASSQVGAVVQHGGAAYVVNAPSLTGASITYLLQPVAGGAAISYTAAVTPQPCGLLDWQDGLAISWGIAAAWIATAVVLSLRKAVHE